MAIHSRPSSVMASIVVMGLMLLPTVLGQACATIAPAYAPVMASGYQSRVVVKGLRTPRGIIFDTLGNLLVVNSGGGGISQIKFTDNGGIDVCLQSQKTILSDTSLNHGIALSADGKTLFVSNLDGVSSYPYDAAAGTVGTKKTLITGMRNGGFHLTRTLLVPKNAPDTLIVQRGSDGNIDAPTTDINSGRSQFRSFNIAAISAASVDYSRSGTVLGWGMRNSVGFGENPVDGGIWSVENSVDDMTRQGKDVHNTNPGEEMNYHGKINDANNTLVGANYGYPSCFAAWDPSVLPANTNIKVGTQFLIGTASGSLSDSECLKRQAPRITFPSHTAPLDIKFKADGSAAFIPFHGSWNRSPPDGYRVSRIAFANGQPTAPETSTNAAVDIMWNSNNADCPNRCFRPLNLAWDLKGRLFMSSDTTGEIFIITGT